MKFCYGARVAALWRLNFSFFPFDAIRLSFGVLFYIISITCNLLFTFKWSSRQFSAVITPGYVVAWRSWYCAAVDWLVTPKQQVFFSADGFVTIKSWLFKIETTAVK